MAAEIVERQRADAAQGELLTLRLAKAESQRRKLLDAYYAGALDVRTLKAEQARIGADIQGAKDRLGDLDANPGEWQEILELAATFATRWATPTARHPIAPESSSKRRCPSASTSRTADSATRSTGRPSTTSSACPSSNTKLEWRRWDSNPRTS